MMQRRFYHLAAFLLAAFYACDGVVMHVAHQYYHAGHTHGAGQVCCALEQSSEDQDAEGCCGHSHNDAETIADAGGEIAYQPHNNTPLHEHENCEICRYLAVEWIVLEAFVTPQQPELVVALAEVAEIRPGFDLSQAPRCRAPPVV